MKKKLENLSAEVSTASLAETAAFFKAEIETWHNVIKTANVKLRAVGAATSFRDGRGMTVDRPLVDGRTGAL